MFFKKEVSNQKSLSCEQDKNKMCFALERYEEPQHWAFWMFLGI